MDFKPFEKVVIPAKEAEALRQAKEAVESTNAIAPPREVTLDSDLVLVIDEPPETPRPGYETHILDGEKLVGLDGEVCRTGSSPPPAVAPPDQVAPGGSVSVTPNEIGESEGTRVAERRETTESAESSDSAPRNASEDRPKPAATTTRDFIIAYDGRFVGHFRTTRRVSNRGVFKKIAERLAEDIDDFEATKVSVYRPVALKVDPSVFDESGEDAFDWFEAV